MKKSACRLLAFLLLITGGYTARVHAATTINVNTTSDGFVSGKTSLRSAVTNANNAASLPVIINVPAGTYALTLGELTLGPGVGHGLANNILILGTNALLTVITQNDGSSRIFDFDTNGDGSATLALANLSLAGGNDTKASSPFGAGVGGGAVLTGDAGSGGDVLNLTNCMFLNNKTAGPGAAIQSTGGKVVMVGCLFTNNSSGLSGGAVYFQTFNGGDTLTANNCVFVNNSVSSAVNLSQGGGLAVDTDNVFFPILILTNCAFGGNTVTSTDSSGEAGDGGGGAIWTSVETTAKIIGCTFTNNQANGTVKYGGAILLGPNSTNLVEYCRFLSNSVASGGAGTQIYIDSVRSGVAAHLTANDNWWASDNGPASGAIDPGAGSPPTGIAPVISDANWLFLTNSASPTSVAIAGTSTVTASFLKDSAGTTVAAANLMALTNLAVVFSGVDGTNFPAQTVLQTSGTAVTTFTGTSAGTGAATATVDGVSSTASIIVTGSSVTVTSVSSSPASVSYNAGQTVPITVTFSGVVTVTGTPHLALSDSGSASYASGSGTAVLTFDYTVGGSDTSAHLDYAATTSLTLNSGTIGSGGTAATLTLPTPGAASSLSANTTIVIDTTNPSVSITAKPLSQSRTNAPTFSFTDSDSGSGVALVQYQLDGGSLTGATSPLQLSGLADGAHTFSLVVTDNAGNAATNSYAWTVDTTAPTVSISAPSVLITAKGPINYTVTWTDANLNLSSISLTAVEVFNNEIKTGSALVTGLTVSNGISNFRPVQLTTLSGDGTISFKVPAGTAMDLASNSASASPASVSVIVDNTKPTVTISAPSVSVTNSSGTVTYNVGYSDVNFSHATLTAAGINLNHSGTASGAVTVTPGAGTATTTNYTVTVASLTGDGALGVTVAGGTSVDLAGNTNAVSAASATFKVDDTSPALTVSAPSTILTNGGGTVSYTVSYFDANFAGASLVAGDITLTNVAVTGTITVTTNNSTNFTVSISNLAGSGAQAIQIAAGTATDLAGNSAPAAGPSASFTVDTTAPTVTLSAPSVVSTNAGGAVSYAVSYFDANFAGASLAAGNITLTNGAVTGAITVTTNNSTNFTVSISNLAGAGAQAIQIVSGTATDLAGNIAPAAGPSASFTVAAAGPTVTGIGTATGAASGNTSVTITGTGFAPGATVAFGTNAATAVTVSGSTNITASSPAGSGTVDVTVTVGGLTSATSSADQFTYATVSNFDLYVANYGNNTISAISSNGVVSVFVGNTGGSSTPEGLAFDSSSNLYVANYGNNTISEVTPGGLLSTFVGNTNGFNDPAGLAFDGAGNLYVANQNNNTVSEVTPGGAVTTFVGNAAGLNQPVGLAFDSSTNLYIANYGANTISMVTPGGVVSTFVSGAGGLNGPVGLAFDSAGNLYACNFHDNTVSKVTPGGVVTTFVSGTAGLNEPFGLIFDAAGNLYVANLGGNSISEVTPGGVVSTFATGFSSPTFLALGSPPQVVVSSVTSSPAGAYDHAGQTVPITVAFSQVVTVTGTPQLALPDGGLAAYVSGSGTATLTFNYVVSAGDTSSRLDYDSTSALGLNGGTIQSGGSAASLSLPTPGAAGSLSANTTIVIDTTAPTVTFSAPSVAQTNGGSVSYTVTFTDTNLRASPLPIANVQTSTTGTANFSTINLTPGTGTGTTTNYTVTLGGVSGNGTLGITIAGGAFSDLAGNTTAATSSTTFTVDTTAPTVTISAPSVAITNGGSASYTVSYLDPDFVEATLNYCDITVNQAGSAAYASLNVTGASGSATGTNYTVTLSGLTGNGSLGISIASGTGVDLAGNRAPAAGPSSNFTVDSTPPAVTISAPTPAGTTNGSGSSVSYTVTYADADFNVATLVSGNITLTNSGVTATVGVVTNNATNFTVTLSGLAGTGSQAIQIAAGTATDLAGNTALAAGPSVAFLVTNAPGSQSTTLHNGGDNDGTIGLSGTSLTNLWTFHATAGDNVVLRFATTNFTVNLNVYGPDGALLSTGAGNDVPFTFTATNSGTFTVQVSSYFSGGGDYVLRLAQFARPAFAPFVAPAVVLTNGGDNEGSLVLGGLDRWSFTAGTGDNVVLRLGTTNYSANLSVYGPDGALLSSGGGNDDPYTFTATNSGTFTALVNDYNTGDTGAYVLRLAQFAQSFSVPAVALANGGANNGTLVLAGLDRWSFTAHTGDNVVLRLDTTNFTGNLSVYGPDGALLSTGGGDDVPFTLTATNSGTFTALVNDYNAGDTGGYVLRLAQFAQSFSVSAVVLTNGGDNPGTLVLGGLDRWSFTAHVGDNVVLRWGTTNFTGNLNVYGPDGALLSTGGGDDVPFTFTATNSGAFTALVSDFNAGDTGAYVLRLAQFAQPFAVPAMVLTNGGVNNGTLVLAGLDRWSFTANTGDNVVLRLDTTNFTGNLSVYGPDGALLSSAGGDDVPFTFTPTNSGTFTALVCDYNAGDTGAYGLRLANFAQTFSVPAVTLTNGGGNNAILGLGALDRWTFTANTGDNVVLRLGTTNFSATLSVYGPNGTLLSTSSGNDDAFTFKATNSGAFTVLVNGYNAGDTGVYVLRLAQFAQSFAVPAVLLTNTVNNGGSVVLAGLDRWTFRAYLGDNVVLQLSTTNFNATLGIYEPDGALLGTGAGDNSPFAFTATNSGAFTALVESHDPGGTGTYALSLSDADTNAPSITISGPSVVQTNGGSVTYSVTLSDSDFAAVALPAATVQTNKTGTANVTGITVTPGTGNGTSTNYTVTLTGVSGSGTLGITIPAGAASDLAGNNSAATPSTTFNVDTNAVSVTIGSPSPSPTSAGPVTYTVTYTDTDFVQATLTAANISMRTSGSATGTVSSVVGGSGSSTGTNYTVTISNISGTGSLNISVAAGTATDLAGNVAPAAGPGPNLTVTAPQLDFPLYVSDAGSGTVQKISAHGVISTFVTNLTSPAGLAFDSATNLFVADNGAGTILKVTPGGSVSTFVTGLNGPKGLAFDRSGNLYVADHGNNSVLKITPGGSSSIFASCLNGPVGLAFDSATNLYSSGSADGAVSKITPSGSVTTFASGFTSPSGLAFDSLGNLYVANSTLNQISMVTTNGTVSVFSASGGGPVGVVLDSAGVLYVADQNANTLSQITTDGSASSFGSGLNSPQFIATSLIGAGDTNLPTVTITGPSTTLTNGGSVTYTVTFSDPDFASASLPAASVQTNITATASVTGITVTPGTGTSTSTNYTVTLTGVSGNGTLGITIPAGAVSDQAGNTNATTSSATFTVNTVLPTVAISVPSVTQTNGGSVSYTVTFSDPLLGGTSLPSVTVQTNQTATASLTGITVTPGTGNGTSTNYTVTLTGVSGNGTLGITVPAGAAFDLAGNNSPSAASSTFTVDVIAPSVLIGAASVAQTNSGSVSFNVTLSDPDFSGASLPSAAVQTNKSSTANVTGIIVTPGTGTGTSTNYSVTLTGISGNGTLGISIPSGAAFDFAGNSSPAAASTTFTVDNVAPVVAISGPSVAQTNVLGTVTYGITLSDPDLAASFLPSVSVQTNKTLSANVGSLVVTSNSATSYTVALSGLTGNGTLGITIPAGAVWDLAGNTNAATASTTFTVDNVAPVVAISGPSVAQTNVLGTVTYGITLSDPDLAASFLPSVSVRTNKTLSVNVGSLVVTSNSATSYTVTLAGLTGNGTLGITVPAGAVWDLAGNTNAATASTTFTVDNVAPVVAISGPSVAQTNVPGTVTYGITLSDPDLAASFLPSVSVLTNKTLSANVGSLVVTSNSATSYTVTLAGLTGNGTIGITVPAGAVWDLAGNTNAATASTTFTVDNVAPVVAISGPSVAQTNVLGTVTYGITLSDPDLAASFLPSVSVLTNKTLSANVGSLVVTSNSATSYTVTLAGLTGNGTVGITIPAGAVWDLAGNTNAATASTTFTVDNVAPVVAISGPSVAQTNVLGTVTYGITLSDPDLAASFLPSVSVQTNKTGTASVGSLVVTSNSATSYTVTVTGLTGNGTVGITVPAGAVWDLAGNTNAATASTTFTVDNVAPVVAISGPSVAQTNVLGTVTYGITLSDPDLAASFLPSVSVQTNKTLSANVGSLVVTSNSATSYTVTVTGLTGNGTLGITIPAGAVWDLAGNTNAATASTTFTVDNVAPVVAISGSSVAQTNVLGTVTYGITLSDPDLAASFLPSVSVLTNKTLSANVGSLVVTSNSATSYTVTLAGLTGNGTVGITIPAGAVWDLAGNTNAATASTTFTVDNVAPVVAISGPSVAQTNVLGTVTYGITLSDPDLAASFLPSVSVQTNKTGTASVGSLVVTSNGATSYTVTVTGLTGNGTLGITVPVGAVWDLAGNTNAATASTTFTVDNVAPVVAISGPSVAQTNVLGTVTYAITLSDADVASTFLPSVSVQTNKTGTASVGSLVVTSNSATSYTATLTGLTGNGTLGITVPVGAVWDLAGNTNAATASTTFTVDNVAPVVAISGPSVAQTNLLGTVTYGITLSDPDLAASFLPSVSVQTNKTLSANVGSLVVTSNSATSYTVVLTGLTGNGTVGITVPAGAVWDLAGNTNAATASTTFTVDNVAPVVAISGPSVAQTNVLGTVTYGITLSDPDLAASFLPSVSVLTNKTLSANVGSLVVTSNSATSYTVTLTGLTGNGTVGITIPAGAVWDLAGNTNAATASTTFTVDNVAPVVAISGPSVAQTNVLGTVTYGITLSDPDLAASFLPSVSVLTNKTLSANVGSLVVTSNSATSYTVVLTGLTGNGTIGITVSAGAVWDLAGNTNAATASTTFTVDNTAPVVAISGPSVAQTNVLGTVTYGITLSDPDLAASFLPSVSVLTNKTLSANVGSLVVTSNSATSYTVALTGLTGNGTIGITVPAGAVWDLAGNTNAATASTTFTVDNVAPMVAISGPSVAQTNVLGTVTYGITLSDPDLAASFLPSVSVQTNKTGTASVGSLVVTSNSATSYTVALTGLTGNGTIGITIPAGAVWDLAGNTNAATASTTFTVDNVAPVVAISGPSVAQTNVLGAVTYGITLSDPDLAASFLLSVSVLTNKTLSANVGSLVVTSNNATSYTVALTGLTGNGTVGITIPAGAVWDLAGNTNAATASTTFTVDNVAPVVAISGPSVAQTNVLGTVTYGITLSDPDLAASFLPSVSVLTNKTLSANVGSLVVTSNSATSYTVTLAGLTGNGTLGITIPAGAVWDLAGNTNAATASTTFTVDNVAPVVAISGPSVAQTNVLGTVTYGITLSDPDLAASFLPSVSVQTNKTGTASVGSLVVTSNGATSYTVTVTGLTGNGTLGITVPIGAVWDLAGNTNAATASTTFEVDNTAPLVVIGSPSVALTNVLGTVTYSVTLSDADLAASFLPSVSVQTNTTGTANVTSLVVQSNSPTSYTVGLSGLTGDGTLGITIPGGAVWDLAGNTNAAATSAVFVVDNTAPSIAISGPSNGLVNGSGQTTYLVSYFDQNFSQSTLTAANITLIPTGTAFGGVISVAGAGGSASGTNYTVTVSSFSGNGTLGISIAPGTAADLAGNKAASAGAGEVFTVDTVSPAVTISGPSTSITNGGDVAYTVSYSDQFLTSATLYANNITLITTGTATGTVSKVTGGTGNATTTNFLVNISGLSGNGTVAISIAAGTATDAAGNTAPAAGPGASFIVDTTAPQVTISGPSPAVTNGGSATYLVTYFDANFGQAGLTADNITLVSSGTAGAVVSVAGRPGAASGTNYLVTLTGLNGDGTLAISIAPGTALDLAGNSAGSPAQSAALVVSSLPPQVTIIGPSVAITNGGSVSYRVNYASAFFATAGLAPSNVTLVKTGTATATVVSVTGGAGSATGTNFTVTLSGLGGNGTVAISIAPGTALDLANNPDAGAGPSASFIVDTTPPAIAISGPSVAITNGGTVNYIVSYTDLNLASAALTPANLTLTSSGTATGTIIGVAGGAGGATGTNYSVTIGNVGGNGALGISIGPGTAIDLAGNTAASAGTSALFTVDTMPPTVTISGPSVAKTVTGPVSYTVSYTDANFSSSTLTAANVILNTTGTATGNAVVSGGGATFTVSLTGISGSGSLGISLSAGTAVDSGGNLAPGGGPSATVQVSGWTVGPFYSFTNGVDGANPRTAVIQARDGAFYGSAYYGGTNGSGSLFRITTNAAFTPLYSFSAMGSGGTNQDGANPAGDLAQAQDGAFYGTTRFGGSNGLGTVFRLTADGSFSTLYTFSGGVDGADPQAGLIQTADGMLYGTASAGGANRNGTFFRISTNGGLIALHSFGPLDGSGFNGEGASPEGSLKQGIDGGLYGTAQAGGASGMGTIFRVGTDGVIMNLHSFGVGDGNLPSGGLVQGQNGVLYGTTYFGGDFGAGTVYQITTNGVFQIIHALSQDQDGANSFAGLIQSSDGTFYGTASLGGPNGAGTVFTVSSNGDYSVIYSFSGGTDSFNPFARLVQGVDGNLYGTSEGGGVTDWGTIFELYQPGSAPYITGQPTGQAGIPGGAVSFNVAARGPSPLSYQWMLNGLTIAGATNSTLILTNLDGTQAGGYSVVVTNVSGSVSSVTARLFYLGLATSTVGTQLLPVLSIGDLPGSHYRIDGTSDLTNPNSWITLTNITIVTSPYLFIDTLSLLPPMKFYRAVPLP